MAFWSVLPVESVYPFVKKYFSYDRMAAEGMLTGTICNTLYLTFLFFCHLADAFIQSDLQIRKSN